ncbi:MAG: metallophosphoesterase family protein [Candidatus Hermodarchaeota archaeon]
MRFKKQIAVMSDIHGNSLALKAVLEDLNERKIQSIFNLGDSLYGPLDPIGTANILIENKIPSLCGNEDRILLLHSDEDFKNNPSLSYVLELIDSNILNWVKRLQKIIEYDNMILFHGTPQNDSEYLIEKISENGVEIKSNLELEKQVSEFNQEIILCGHSHVPRSIYLQSGKLIINPGSVGLPAYADNYPYPHVMESGTPHARYCIISRNEKHLWIENVSVSYNWEEAASRARENGRPDWENWLRYGRT